MNAMPNLVFETEIWGRCSADRVGLAAFEYRCPRAEFAVPHRDRVVDAEGLGLPVQPVESHAIHPFLNG